MAFHRKSSAEAKQFGAMLRQRRKALSFTLQDVAQEVGVDVGQLSRFERGDFRVITPNLQKFAAHLQKQKSPDAGGPLVARFARVIAKSDRHLVAAQAMVDMLESLN